MCLMTIMALKVAAVVVSDTITAPMVILATLATQALIQTQHVVVTLNWSAPDHTEESHSSNMPLK